MEIAIVITGISLISCLGNLQTSWQKLLAGQTGIAIKHPFVTLPPSPLGLIANQPTRLNELIPPLIQEVIAAAELSLPQPDCGVVIGSSRGMQAIWETLTPVPFPPTIDWLATLPQEPALIAARCLGTTGPVLAPMAACATGIWTIAQGVELINQGICERVIVGAVEAPVTPLTLTGFAQMGALANSGCYPFDCRRQGLVLGEGGAIFVLETLALAQERNARIYGQVSGFGFSCDAYHLSSPSPDGQAAIAAIKQCLQQAELTPAAIDYIHAHGTSTKLNDQREAALIAKVFGPAVAVSSTKGATGHTLGASGAMGAAFTSLALQTQTLPPCVGLETPEFALNFSLQARPDTLKHALCFSFGFGGQNAILALSQI